ERGGKNRSEIRQYSNGPHFIKRRIMILPPGEFNRLQAQTPPPDPAQGSAEGENKQTRKPGSPDIDLTQEPLLKTLTPRATPPMPSTERAGVVTDNKLSLTLNAAIRMALENNNDITVKCGNVRYATAP